jgi:hypothetical protein
MHRSLALGSGDPGWDLDQVPTEGGSAGHRMAIPARVPAARSRLCVIAASTVHALFGGKNPDGMWAKVPSMKSANTDSRIACWRWVMSASVTGSVLLVNNGWYRQTGYSFLPDHLGVFTASHAGLVIDRQASALRCPHTAGQHRLRAAEPRTLQLCATPVQASSSMALSYEIGIWPAVLPCWTGRASLGCTQLNHGLRSAV